VFGFAPLHLTSTLVRLTLEVDQRVGAGQCRVSEKWRRVKMSEYDLTILRNLRKLYGWEESEQGYISKRAAA